MGMGTGRSVGGSTWLEFVVFPCLAEWLRFQARPARSEASAPSAPSLGQIGHHMQVERDRDQMGPTVVRMNGRVLRPVSA